jgi:L-serine dehydratase
MALESSRRAYQLMVHENGTAEQVRNSAHRRCNWQPRYRSSISGAEVGCQEKSVLLLLWRLPGCVQHARHIADRKCCEIALEHHLGMTCDPVGSLVQVPCIERNGFGAIKAYTAASLAIRGDGQHFMSLDNCIAAMKQTGLEMSVKYKETSLGGAVSITEC